MYHIPRRDTSMEGRKVFRAACLCFLWEKQSTAVKAMPMCFLFLFIPTGYWIMKAGFALMKSLALLVNEVVRFAHE